MQSYFEKKKVIDKIIGGIHEKPETLLVWVWEIKDLALWAKEKNYNYKEIKILNRWIVGDSLPEWEWEIKILNR
jgi:hypothetical protein